MLVFIVACASTPLPEAELEHLRMGDVWEHWRQGEWALMVSPIQPPTSAHGDQRITVWLRLPDNAELGAGLEYPPGTAAERVEMRFRNGRWQPLDVRGIVYAAGRQRMYLLRPEPRSAGLVGFAWGRGDMRARRSAMRSLEGVVAREGYEPVSSFCGNQDCGGCHVRDKPAHPLPADAGGLFRVRTVLEDATPLLESRERDPNIGSRFVTLTCDGGGVAITHAASGDRVARCVDGRHVPIAHFDMRAALAASDAHALAVCASRGYLALHMDDLARAQYRAALDECHHGED